MALDSNGLLRRTLVCLAALVVGAATASPQGTGVVEGRLRNGTDGKIVPAGVDLEVVSVGGATGMTNLKSAVTDAQGRFRIEGLPTANPLLIRANYKLANYHGRPTFDVSGKAQVEITVYETTTSMAGISVSDVRLGFQMDGEHLRALETYTFVNETKPPRTYMNTEGNFRFSKPAGVEGVPRMQVSGPGGMPLQQNPVEDPRGASYHSLYPLRPGKTTFEIEYALPYHERSYEYRKKFYNDIPAVLVGVLPYDLKVSGGGLVGVHSEPDRNFAVYQERNVRAGAEVVWTFAGGTPPAATPTETAGRETQIKPMPNAIGRNTLLIGPLVLMALIGLLWYAFTNLEAAPAGRADPRGRELRSRRERLLDFIAALDERYEKQAIERGEYARQREAAKRQLRRIAMLLPKR